MIIKTITCHKVYNVGASLQAYALAKYLTDLGHDVEIIDYRPEYLSRHYRLDVVNNPKFDRPFLRKLYLLAKLPGRIKESKGKRKRNFDEFEKKYLPLTKNCYCSNEDLKKNPPLADVYLAGSDQIWNTLFQTGRDITFYLDFAPIESVRASYAASFATENILEEWKEPIKCWLKNMDFISVRESSGVELVKELGINYAKQVMDPVFLLDKSIWEGLAMSGEAETPYLLVYDFDRNSEINEHAKKIAEERNLKIYSIFDNSEADCCYTEAGPLEFLGLVRGAEYVISNSFHATAFAIIFEKPFAVFERKEKINTRLKDLIELLGLSKINNSIEYNKVNLILEKSINESKKYLEEVTSNCKGC